MNLRPYINEYQALAELYATVKNAFSPNAYVDRELTAKTRELLHQHTAGNLELPGAIHTLGVAELEALRQSTVTDTTKVLNLRKILAVTVNTEGLSKPFLLSIGERAEALAEAYEDRQITTQQALAEFEKLAQEAVDADTQRKGLEVDENTFAIYTALRPVGNGLKPEQASDINDLFTRYPNYGWNEMQKSKLRAELYKTLRPLVGLDKMIDVANTLLKLQRV